MSQSRTFKRSLELFDRACQVIPGGIYGHTTPANCLPLESPYYAKRAKGCRYWDEDDHEYIDFKCAYGPIVLGYQHPEVEEAAQQQALDGNCFNHPSRIMVELAEHMVNLVDFASWCVFGKNGSDMTSWAIQVAREYTRRKKILMVEGAYHGTHAWCTPGHAGLIEEDRHHIHRFRWNDLESLRERISQWPDEIAGVIVTPYHHPVYSDSLLPEPGFLQGVEKLCRHNGIQMTLDDVRAGFRLHLGGSHRYFGFTPDLICSCKALGNGHPISAALGSEPLKLAASKVFLTGSYWGSGVPMRAALTCLKILERDRGIDKMMATGKALANGLNQAATRHGLSITVSGPPSIPFMTFKNQDGSVNLKAAQIFTQQTLQKGAFFHPHHNWFLCTAHDDQDIDQAIHIAEQGFIAVKDYLAEVS